MMDESSARNPRRVRLLSLRTARPGGAASLFFIALLFVGLVFGALAVDMSYYYTRQNQMVTAAASASMAGAQELFKNTAASFETRRAAAITVARNYIETNSDMTIADGDVDFGFVNPATRQYDAATFGTPSGAATYAPTGGYNSVRVNLKAGSGESNSPLSSFFAQMLGVNALDASAVSTSIYGGGISEATGLRPFYMCQSAWEQVSALGGDISQHTVRFYGDRLIINGTTVNAASSCGNLGPGNWGLADFTEDCGTGVAPCSGGSPGGSTVSNWISNGYSGTVYSGHSYSAKPGSISNTYSNDLDQLIGTNKVYMVPLYRQSSGNGSSASFYVEGMASFVFTDYQLTGSQSNRYIEGHFVNTICHANCAIKNTTSTIAGTTKLYNVH